MLKIKLLDKKPAPGETEVSEIEIDGRISMVAGYEASWTVDSDEGFMIETASLELEALDVLTADITYGDSFFCKMVGLGYGAAAPHIPGLIRFIIERPGGTFDLDFFEDGLFLTFEMEETCLVTRVKQVEGGEVYPETVREDNAQRLLLDLCSSLDIFVRAIQTHLPKLHQRKEYKTWLDSKGQVLCRQFLNAQTSSG